MVEVWVTKWALTRGVFRAKVTHEGDGYYRVRYAVEDSRLILEHDFCFHREVAVARVAQMKTDAIAKLEAFDPEQVVPR